MTEPVAAGGTLWQEGVPPIVQRPPLDGDRDVDVVVVGAGYTGLWTAYYLACADPTLRILVAEREFAGFGASGRNGGWCVGEIAASIDQLAAASSRQGALRMMRALFDAVDEVGRVCSLERIDCDFAKGGTIRLARSRAQLDRLAAEVAHHHAFGLREDDLRLLDATETRRRLAATEVVGGTFFAHTAALQPLRLVRGLADAVERRGVTIVEGTTAREVAPGRVVTDHGVVTASVVVRATEGYTPSLRGNRRTLAPLYSLMIATEPLSERRWDEIGLADRATFADARHLVIYGQRTADGRIAFGGRGAPYGYGSRIDPAIERQSAVHDLVARTLVELLPMLDGVAVTHRWGGVLGVPRDWFPSVGFDRATGLGWAGGYVGEGVAASNLAGRTLAELVRGERSERVDLAWVDHRSRRWEPEPLRWLGVNAALRVMATADAVERRGGPPARRARWLWRVMRGASAPGG